MKSCTITVIGNKAYFEGDYPLDYVRKLTSFPVKNAFFTKKYKSGVWDGRKHLFRKKTKKTAANMPAGLLTLVYDNLRKFDKDLKINIYDKREESVPVVGNNGFDLNGINFGANEYSYQIKAVETGLKYNRGIYKMATNAGKTAVAAALIKHLSIRTIFIVPGLDLLHQTRSKFSKLLSIPIENIGIIGDMNCVVGDFVTVANMDSLHARLADKTLDPHTWDMLFTDECHFAGAVTCYEALDQLPAYYRFGLSGTPLDRADEASLRLIAQTGPIIFEVKNKELIERGISVPPYVEIIEVNSPTLEYSKKQWRKIYEDGVINNNNGNTKIAARVNHYLNNNKQVIIFIDELNHGQIFENKLKKHNPVFLNGSYPTDERKKILQKFVDGEIRCLIGSSILNQGIDIDCIDVMAFAAQKKATIATLQRVGRGLRKGPKKDKVIIIEIANFCHEHLLKHSQTRFDIYKQEDCFNMRVLKDDEIDLESL